MQYKSPFTFTCLLFLSYLSALYATPPAQITVSEIKKSLVCLCECNMTVEACQGAMACDSAEKLTAEATQYVEQGLNKKAIFAAFIGKYGEHILAAPTKKGFNLTAWILPFAAIFIAGFGIVRVVQRWVRPSQNRSAKIETVSSDNNRRNSKYEQKLDEVLRGLD
ncbi:MAG: cytochrome c-type biogenesis protein CcmH [bacterium]